jgi:hypothetical protein
VIAVDGRVELIVGAHRHEVEDIRILLCDAEVCFEAPGHDEVGPARLGLPAPFARRDGTVEASRLPHAIIKAAEIFRIGFLDRIANASIISHPLIPGNLVVYRQRRLRDLRDDARF